MYEEGRPGYRGWYSDYATGWVARGSNPGGGEISRNARLSSPEVGHGVNQLPISSAEVKGRVEIYLYYYSGTSCLF